MVPHDGPPRLAWPVAALVLALAVQSTLGVQPVGDPIAEGSWGQRFVEDVGSYDHIQMRMVAGSSFRKLAAITSFSPAG